jgi:hypothetical protein
MRRKKLVRPVLLGAFALSMVAVIGCAGEAVRFNNTIAGYNKRLNEAGTKFGKAIAPAAKGLAVNVGEAKAAYQQVKTVVNEVKAEFAALKVPSGASAKKMADAYAQFLKGQEHMVNNDFAQIMTMVESGKVDQGRFNGLLLQVSQREQGDLAALQAAQREFAKEHGIRLQAAP